MSLIEYVRLYYTPFGKYFQRNFQALIVTSTGSSGDVSAAIRRLSSKIVYCFIIFLANNKDLKLNTRAQKTH